MNGKRRFIRGRPAFLLLLGVGGVALAWSGYELAHADQSGSGPLFVLGLAAGYMPPLSLRIAGLVGPDRVASLRWLRLAVLALFFLPLLAPLIALVIAPLRATPVFGGTLVMWMLGGALQEDAQDKAAA